MPESKCTIAIVEDDASFRRALERFLRASGFNVHTFASAEEFLGSAAPESYACLILNIHLPGMSGFELVDHLTTSIQLRRRSSSPRGTRTACGNSSRIPHTVYLSKPFPGEVLLEAVRSLLSPSGSYAESSGT